MTFKMDEIITHTIHRVLSAESNEHLDSTTTGHDSHEEDHFGVHVKFFDLYAAILFITAIFVSGKIVSNFLLMPSLVGEIITGIVLGPNLLSFVPPDMEGAFVLMGELGLYLLVIEAGIDIDLTTLKLIGARGVTIAIVGSILPIAIGYGIAVALGIDQKGAIAAGAAFGPTSLGIAMNILQSAKIVNTPVGQLIIAAAIIDDMIALVILSQLGALVGETTLSTILIPIVSALSFIIIGGYLAVFQLPKVLDRFVFPRLPAESKGSVSLGILFLLVIGLMPATKYSQASPLMGAFIAGLVFCSNHEAHVNFVSQLKRVMQWLMRIFFAASIGFQVPIDKFGDGQVILNGLIFTLALLGKLLTGFLVPNFTQNRRFTGMHRRDALVVGFSMAAEGEFAFVIAVFAVDKKIIDETTYASIVLAVLLSTILAPLALRLTIASYNKVKENQIRDAEKLEHRRMSVVDSIDDLATVDKLRSTVFLCIQTQSDSSWGLLPAIMNRMSKLQLEAIDHRSWNPRGANTTLVNEIYVKDDVKLDDEHVLDARLVEIQQQIIEAIGQEAAKVKVHRWFPGIVEEMIEETTVGEDGSLLTVKRKEINVRERILQEAEKKLEEDKNMQTMATLPTPIEETLEAGGLKEGPSTVSFANVKPQLGRRKPSRRRMSSTPVIGGDLFGAVPEDSPVVDISTGPDFVRSNMKTIEEVPSVPGQSARRRRILKTKSTPSTGGDMFNEPVNVLTRPSARDQTTNLMIGGQTYNVIVDPEVIRQIIADSGAGSQIDRTKTPLLPKDIRTGRRQRERVVSFDKMLGGFIRKEE